MIWGRKVSRLKKPDVEFVSAPMLKAALAMEAYERKGPPPLAWDRPDRIVLPRAQEPVPVRPWYASRITPPEDHRDFLAVVILLAATVEEARDQLATALKQRGSAARVADFRVEALPLDAEGRDYGIVATTMIRRRR